MNKTKNIEQLPISSCPLCGESTLTTIEGGKRLFIFKNPDTIKCSNCGAIAFLGQDGQSFRYKSIPSPYAFFNDYYANWVSPHEASQLAKSIKSNSKAALSYLPDSKKHAWKIRIIVDGNGDADSKGINIVFSWEDEPDSKDEAKRELARIIQMQKEIRQVKREMGLEMKEIRAHYGRRKENQAAKTAALSPYENTTVVADNVLVQLDRAKLNIQNWVDDQL